MSWDVIIHDLPAVDSVADIPSNFQPLPLGLRDEIVARLLELFPHADFHDPSWGVIDGPEFSIEVGMGDAPVVESIALHVHGDSDLAPGIVADLIDHLGGRALDMQTGEFFNRADARSSFEAWRRYRAQSMPS